jgi:hypothetical protein
MLDPEFKPRWVLSQASKRAHLDLGERSSRSLRVRGEHIIVTACRAHLDPNAEPVVETYGPRCSNCVRIARGLQVPQTFTKSGAQMTTKSA